MPRKGEEASNEFVARSSGCLRGADSCRTLLSARASLVSFIMVRPSHDCTAKDHRWFHCILTDVLLSSKDRNEEWFERCQQIRVQTNKVGDKLEGVSGSIVSQMFKHQWTTLSQTHGDGGSNNQDGFCIRTRACEQSASSTTT